jgi:hypothetical protein
MLHIAAVKNWTVNQMDVKNVFLHGHLVERVYCQQPAGFVDPQHPDHACLLDKSLYGLNKLHAPGMIDLRAIYGKSDSPAPSPTAHCLSSNTVLNWPTSSMWTILS